MNKKAQSHALETFGKVFLISLVIFLLITVGIDLLKKASGSGTGLFDSWLEGLGLKIPKRDLTTLNEKAQNNFNLLIQEYNSCLTIQKDNCVCLGNIGFNDFSDVHALRSRDGKFELLIIKNKNELLKDTRVLNMPTCYATRNNFRNINKNYMITFGEDGPLLKDENDNEFEFAKGRNLVFYKKSINEVCWISKDRSRVPSVTTC